MVGSQAQVDALGHSNARRSLITPSGILTVDRDLTADELSAFTAAWKRMRHPVIVTRDGMRVVERS